MQPHQVQFLASWHGRHIFTPPACRGLRQPQLGQGDLLLTSGCGIYGVAEAKRLDGRNKNNTRVAQRKVEEQARRYASTGRTSGRLMQTLYPGVSGVHGAGSEELRGSCCSAALSAAHSVHSSMPASQASLLACLCMLAG